MNKKIFFLAIFIKFEQFHLLHVQKKQKPPVLQTGGSLLISLFSLGLLHKQVLVQLQKMQFLI